MTNPSKKSVATAPVEPLVPSKVEEVLVQDPPTNPSPLDKPPIDYAKTKFYARADLFVKTLAALSVATIGIAGYLFQMTNAEVAERRKTQELEDQRFLPMFDGLASLELTIDDYLASNPYESKPAKELAEILLWRNMSLHVPSDTSLQVRIPAYRPTAERFNKFIRASDVGRLPVVEMPLREAIAVTAQIYRLAAAHRALSPEPHNPFASNVTLENGAMLVEAMMADGAPPPPVLTNDVWKGDVISLPIDAESENAIFGWAFKRPPEESKLPPMIYFEPGTGYSIGRELLISLRSEIARLQRETLAQRPALGEKYLAVRTNLIANKTYRRPPRDTDPGSIEYDYARISNAHDRPSAADLRPSTAPTQPAPQPEPFRPR